MGGAFGDRVYGSESRPVLPTLARGAARGSLGQDELLSASCRPPAPPRQGFLLSSFTLSKKRKEASFLQRPLS